MFGKERGVDVDTAMVEYGGRGGKICGASAGVSSSSSAVAGMPPLKAASTLLADGDVENIQDSLVAWIRNAEGGARPREGGISRRAPHVTIEKVHATWLTSPSLHGNKKRCALRWFLHWFPARGEITIKQVKAGEVLKGMKQTNL